MRAGIPWHYANVPFVPQTGTPSDNMHISRPLYETLLRKNVRERCKNVRFVPGVVTGLNPAKNDRSRIGSVDVKMKGESGVVQ